MNAKQKKAVRLEHANQLIKTISSYGRRFFYNKEHDRVAHLTFGPNGHIYLVDDYTGKAIYTAYRGHWSGFSHGGTLRSLIQALANYVRTGEQLYFGVMGPQRTDGSNIWGYAEAEMAKCREEAAKSPIFE